LHYFSAVATAQLDLGTLFGLNPPTATGGQLQQVDLHVQRLKARAQSQVHTGHGLGLGNGALHARQTFSISIVQSGFKHLALFVDQSTCIFITPQGHGPVLQQDRPQTVGEIAVHHRNPDPRHRLKCLLRLGQIDGEKIAFHFGQNLRAEGKRVVAAHLALHGDRLQCKAWVANEPPCPSAQCQQHKRNQQQSCGHVHEPDIGGQGHGGFHAVAPS
jgi:hypothetical protein